MSYFQIGPGRNIADFGCGPGLYTTPLAETGADVTGIDFSSRSIQYAKRVADQKALNITYYQTNYLNFDTNKRFDLITMIFCDYCALSPSQRKSMLTKYYKILKHGGSVLLDVHSLNAFNAREEVRIYEYNQLDNFWSSDNYYGFLNTFKYDKEKTTLDKYTIFEKTRSWVIYNWLQYFNQDSLRKEFEEVGFVIDEFYTDVAGSTFSPESPDITIVARKSI